LKKIRIKVVFLLIPYLILYVIYIIIKAKPALHLDEPTYLFYARNLLLCFYAPENTTFLWAGPGYPILLAILEKLNIPPVYQKLFNACFLSTSLLLIYNSLKMYISRNNAILITLLAGLYYPFYEMLPYRMTEVFVILLISMILYLSNRCFLNHNKKGWMVLLIIFSGWLMITKIIFGYVFVALLLIFTVGYLINQQSTHKLFFNICFFSLLISTPYLYYTYQKTGKFFYWGTSGGMTLYWMSSPYPEEYGDFINFFFKPSKDETKNQLYKMRHEQNIKRAIGNITIFEKINYEKLPAILGVQQDQQFKRLAIRNIRENPSKYLKNCLFNISRMLFNLPYSYRNNQINMKYLICNSILLLLFMIAFANIFINKIKIPQVDFFLITFMFIYLGGSSLLSANPRQFYIISPIIFYFIGRYLLNGPYIMKKLKLILFRSGLK